MTFYEFLMTQKVDNAIGDLAHDVRRDPTFPHRVSTWEEVRRHLHSRDACDDALQAAREAWGQWCGCYPECNDPACTGCARSEVEQ